MTVPSPPAAVAGEAQTGEKPQPPPTFDVLPLSSELRETLAEIGYVHPTPVQLAVWEPVTRGRDAVVQARTGTGKTAAFGLPIVDHAVKRSLAQAQVLALCPTRELALQVSAEIERLGKRKGIKVVAVYGGAPMQRQIDALAAGAQVIVGTPGRVLDHLRRGTIVAKHIRLLVLDECDEMLSMGFERELTAILAELPPERQTLLFSATLPPDIERIARSKLRSPEFVTLSGDAVGALQIQHFVYLVTGDKHAALIRILEVENPENAVVFCNTKDETEAVAAALKRQGYDADWLNGDLPQSDREKVMSATREGRLRFLVATDVAARGIDISHLTHVINYDFPQDAEAYVHRTGRTGRAGRTGTAIALITPQDVGPLYILRLTYKIRPLEKQLPTEGELKTRAEADLVSMLAEAFLPKGTHPEDLSLARRLLTHDQAEAIVAGLLRDHLGARPTAQEEASAARRAQQPRAAAREAAVPSTRPEPAARGGSERGEGRPARDAIPRAADSVDPRSPETERSSERDIARAAGGARDADRDARDGDRDRGRERDRRSLRLRRDEGRRGPRGADAPAGDEPREPRRPEVTRARDEGPVSVEPLTRPEPLMRIEPPRAEGGPGRGPAERLRERPGAATLLSARRGPAVAGVAGAPGRAHGGAPGQPFSRHADFTMWQPPEEEGDDEPILGEPPSPPPGSPASRGGDRERASGPAPLLPVEPAVEIESVDPGDSPRAAAVRDEPEGEFVEVFINLGRRDGARAADFQRVLVERAGMAKGDIRRIRVRERNAFVSVPKAELARVVGALNGATIAGKEARAEQARERTSSAEEVAEDA
ncbi:DEAD/DEAH box helicase [Sorangium sp. So ce119]|uniref:DEAD/DEAH box helicase n=1 Tax=Sorangium sp. So ce119 TaxID=3133279 RepID=UPI003F63AF56